jgi:hypothetical protein
MKASALSQQAMFLTLFIYKAYRFHLINLTSYLGHVHMIDASVKTNSCMHRTKFNSIMRRSQKPHDASWPTLLEGNRILVYVLNTSLTVHKHQTFTSWSEIMFSF